MKRKNSFIKVLKATVYLAFIFAFQSVFAQSDSSKVDENKTRINNLNERLDKIVKTASAPTKADSMEIKLDMLLKQMKEVKREIASIKSTISENIQAKEAGSKISAEGLEEGKYYVVIGSRRNKELAEKLFQDLSGDNEIKLVKNTKDTWHHIILIKAFSKSEAIYMVKKLRAGNFKDAWWTTVKNIKN